MEMNDFIKNFGQQFDEYRCKYFYSRNPFQGVGRMVVAQCIGCVEFDWKKYEN